MAYGIGMLTQVTLVPQISVDRAWTGDSCCGDRDDSSLVTTEAIVAGDMLTHR